MAALSKEGDYLLDSTERLRASYEQVGNAPGKDLVPEAMPYDGFDHFCKSISATPNSLMSMFTLYCDDSGTHPKSEVAVAACYVSTVEQWTECKRNWDEANQREHFGVFHMSDFVAKQEQFAAPEWENQAKRDRTVQLLINLIKTRATFGVAAVVDKAAYDEVIVNGHLQSKFGDNHYAYCIRICTAMVNRWREKYHYGEPIQWVFDRLSKGKGDIDAMFNTLLSGGEDAMKRYGIYKDCWSFQDKAQVTQLQAADIWAWENYKYSVDSFFPRHNGRPYKPPRKSYLALNDSPCMVKYHVRESLQELVKQVSDWEATGA
jgi:Protein of unknown function (DUF3800)